VYRSGDWEIDLAQRELRSNGIPVPVRGLAFEIIEVLVKSAGELVSKRQLADIVWPGMTVGENTLHVHISGLRKALGDGRGMLKTVAGRGYRLLGNWTIRTDDFVDEPGVQEQGRSPAPRFVSNLPTPVDDLIGRGEAVRRLLDVVSANRVVTLTGAGGIGKTVLALEVVRNLFPGFGGDCLVVGLAPLSNPELVPSAVAGILGLKWTGDEILPETVAGAIGTKKMLLMLDNCEHVIGAVAPLAEAIVRMCPKASVLVTSRELLRIGGEFTYRVGPLDVPPEGRSSSRRVMEHSAVQLFVARVRALRGEFSPNQETLVAIATICRRLDGIPLAIELAAARAASLGPELVASLLDNRFKLLTSGSRTALPRHQALRATLDWSYELLPNVERRVLHRLAIFASAFALSEACAVVVDREITETGLIEHLGNLVARSLVAADINDVIVRYRLLETTRVYAFEKLEDSGELNEIARRHAECYIDLLAKAAAEPERIAHYFCHIDELRAALDWAFSPNGDHRIGVALTLGAVPLWMHFSLLGECRKRAESAILVLSGSTDRASLEMRLQAALAISLLHSGGPVDRIETAWTWVFEIAQAVDDRGHLLQALEGLWMLAINSSRFREALTFAQRAHDVATDERDPSGLLISDRMMGTSLHYLGDLPRARRHLEEALSLDTDRAQRPTIWGAQVDPQVSARATLARTLWLQGFPDRAWEMARASAAEARRRENAVLFCFALNWALVPVALLNGNLDAAQTAVSLQLKVSAEHGADIYYDWARSSEAVLLARQGDPVTGISALRLALSELQKRKLTVSRTIGLRHLAEVSGFAGQVAQGLSAIDEALEWSERNEERWCRADLLRIKGDLLLLERGLEAVCAAEVLFEESLDCARRQAALSWELRTTISFSRLLSGQGRGKQAHGVLSSAYGRFTEGYGTADLLVAKELLQQIRVD
jgi:predicted ATPase/DNA-binding winged helix-turn-helix (wHTH) protein